jgi:hypothetical protein
VWFWTAEAMGATTEDSDAPRSSLSLSGGKWRWQEGRKAEGEHIGDLDSDL